jgi:hypothetical protein
LVTASDDYGAGIGGGYAEYGNSSFGSITITGGTVTANGLYGAGIGTGYALHGWALGLGNTTISGGTEHATGNDSAGIGSGQADSNATSTLDCIIICGNPVIQAEWSCGAGIGAGCWTGGTSGLNSIETSGGTINATGTGVSDGSPGIGAGKGHSRTLKLHNILIHGRIVNATGIAVSGIGAGIVLRRTS